MLLSHSPQIAVITETWLSPLIPDDCIIPPGYLVHRWDRDSRGGGVAILVKSPITTERIDCSLSETVWCKIFVEKVVFIVGAIYRPPGTTPDFLDQLNSFLCKFQNGNTRLILTGDFNLPHINWESVTPGHIDTLSGDKMLEIMFSHNLTQIVKENTRVTANSETLLDLVFLSRRVTHSTLSVEEGISDHKLITVDIQLDAKPQKRPFIPVQIKNFARADDTSILDYLELSLHEFELASVSESVEELWQRFKIIVKHCTDKFVPTRKKKTKQRSPWITQEIVHIK